MHKANPANTGSPNDGSEESCLLFACAFCTAGNCQLCKQIFFFTKIHCEPVCAVRGDVAGDAQQEMRCAQVLQPSPTVPLERPSSPTSSLARSRTPSRPDRPGPCVRPRSCARSASLLRARRLGALPRSPRAMRSIFAASRRTFPLSCTLPALHSCTVPQVVVASFLCLRRVSSSLRIAHGIFDPS